MPPTLLLPAVRAAVQRPHAPLAKLYTNGERVEWLLRPLPGWFRIGVANVKQPQQETTP